MDLRPALSQDAPQLGDFGRTAFVTAFGHLYRSEDLDPFLEQVYAVPAMRAVIEDPDELIQLAVEGQTIIGYCRMKLACGWAEHARGHNVVEVKNLYVDPAGTSRGIGARLMNWAIDEARARGADEIQLSVWSENHGAQRFYRRYGFEKIADIAFWVNTHRDDEFLFSLLLREACEDTSTGIGTPR